MKRIYFYLIISFIFIISLLTDNVFAYKNTYKNIQVFQSNTPQLEASITIAPNNSNRILIGAKINGKVIITLLMVGRIGVEVICLLQMDTQVLTLQ